MSQKQQNYNWGSNWFIVNQLALTQKLFKAEDLNLAFNIVFSPHLAFHVPINVYSDAD